MVSRMRYHLNIYSHILATLYNKVNVLGSLPPSWSHSVVKLLHKKGPTMAQETFKWYLLHLLLQRLTISFLQKD